MLLAISNDVSLRALGTRNWKSAQRWIYAVLGLTVAHGIAYQLIEKRRLPWVIIFASITIIAGAIQVAGVTRTRKMAHKKAQAELFR